MKRLGLCMLLALTIGGTGCSGGTWDWDPDWDAAAPSIERFVELSARIAFAREDVAPYKPQICKAVGHIANVLKDYDDPDATFAKMRVMIIGSLDGIPLDPEVKKIVVLVLDQILDIAFMYARESYLDLINKDENQAALKVSRAIATGLNNACVEQSLKLFKVSKQ